jgi:hypothetical protein
LRRLIALLQIEWGCCGAVLGFSAVSASAAPGLKSIRLTDLGARKFDAKTTCANRGGFRAEPQMIQLGDSAQSKELQEKEPMHQDKPLLQEYISRAITTEYKLVDSCQNQIADIPSQEIKIQIDEDEFETSAFGIMYSISLLSFLQGRPAGASVIEYQEQDV